MRLLAAAFIGILLAGCATPSDPSGVASMSDTVSPSGPGISNGTTAPPPSPRNWSAPQSAAIRPGASLDDGSCTANFVFTSLDNATVYLGTAAHCFSESGPTATDGCEARTKGLGTTMEVHGASKPARLVYSSWIAMQEGNASSDACAYNDFALLELDAADHAKVSPAMHRFGGPTGIAQPASIQEQDKVLTYGNSNLRPRDSPLSPKEGIVLVAPEDGWSMVIDTLTPGVPGDSGSGVLTKDGLAAGNVVTLGAYGNGVSMLQRELDWAREEADFDVRLATWELLDAGIL